MTAAEPSRLPIVGVMGSGTRSHDERAAALGRWLANAGVHLLTGGGKGTMTAVSRSFHEVSPRRGKVIGVVPGRVNDDSVVLPDGYPNPWVEIPIITHLWVSGEEGMSMGSRNHINVLSADVVIALPGSAGTASEVRLALKYEKPLMAFVRDRSEIPGLPEEVRTAQDLDAVAAFVRRELGLAG